MTLLPKIGSDISLSEKAYQVIRDAIINNTLKPREILSEEALAKDLGISRTPVRAALKQLAYERLIILNAGKNAIVADISVEDMNKVFPVRIALEPLAAKIASTNINKEQISMLQEILNEQKKAIESEDYNLYVLKDYEFHNAIAKFSNNEIICDMIETINTHSKRFLILSLTLQANSSVALQEHFEILEALKKGSPDLTEEKMKNHVERVADRIFANCDNNRS